MPSVLPNTQTANAYPIPGAGGCQIGIGDVFASGYFVVANAAAACQFFHGAQGQQDPSPDIFLPPATYPLAGTDTDPLGGIRFKSAIAGTPAQVFGVLYKKEEAQLLAGSEFGAQVSTSGGISAGGAAMTGRIAANGAILGGSGFACARVGVGQYTITFNTAFPSIPVVVCGGDAQIVCVPNSSGITVNGFSVQCRDVSSAGGPVVDIIWDFAVFVMV